MQKSLFKIPQMDCPSEENLIRMQLEGQAAVKNLDFDLPKRELTVYHEGSVEPIEQALFDLDLGSRKIRTEESQEQVFQENQQQKRLLWIVLSINFAFFLIESITGFVSNSMGLVADSLDMLADAFVYGLSLFAVGAAVSRKKQVAKTAGYFQMGLATFGFIEVIRRFLESATIPDSTLMIGVSAIALLANGLCLYLLQQAKNKEEAHLKASLIFTSNDIIINLGVIAAGLLVSYSQSRIPDLIVGGIVFVLVMQGARRILRLGR